MRRPMGRLALSMTGTFTPRLVAGGMISPNGSSGAPNFTPKAAATPPPCLRLVPVESRSSWNPPLESGLSALVPIHIPHHTLLSGPYLPARLTCARYENLGRAASVRSWLSILSRWLPTMAALGRLSPHRSIAMTRCCGSPLRLVWNNPRAKRTRKRRSIT